MIRKEEVYNIGKLGKPHGVKGEISMMFMDDVFDRVDADYLVLLIDGIFVPFYIDEYRFRSNSTVLIKFCDIETMEQARQITGCEVFFPCKLSDGGVDTFTTLNEVIGFTVINATDNSVVGTVKAVDDSTANVLLETVTAGGEEILIPASEELITILDRKKRIIEIAVPEGLLDI